MSYHSKIDQIWHNCIGYHNTSESNKRDRVKKIFFLIETDFLNPFSIYCTFLSAWQRRVIWTCYLLIHWPKNRHVQYTLSKFDVLFCKSKEKAKRGNATFTALEFNKNLPFKIENFNWLNCFHHKFWRVPVYSAPNKNQICIQKFSKN